MAEPSVGHGAADNAESIGEVTGRRPVNAVVRRRAWRKRMEQQAETVRTMICHENELANHRASWLNAVQGLLFAAMAFAWNGAPGLVRLVAGVGIVVAILSLLALGMSTYAITQLLRWWQANKGDYRGPPVVGAFVRPESIIAYLAPWNILPLVFLVAWIFVWVIHG